MLLTQFSLQDFRNIDSAHLTFKDGLNLIYGQNGSGKTSLLEGLCLLNSGRSFRSYYSDSMIRHDRLAMILFAKLQNKDSLIKVGLQKHKSGKTRLRLNDTDVQQVSDIASYLPVQVISPESFSLIFDGPKARRKFMDWGVFYISQEFHELWLTTQRLLKQRNILLKQSKSNEKEVSFWNHQLQACVQRVTDLREEYISSLNEALQGIIELFIPAHLVEVSFYAGWDRKRSYIEALDAAYERDRALGYTSIGPQKADIRLRIGRMSVQDVLSRGQLKLLVCALRIAQGIILKKQVNKSTLYLVDDLPSKLDEYHRRLLLSKLLEIEAQILVTAIEPSLITDVLSQAPNTMFHVKHGQVTEVNMNSEK